jgi:hypothetical protein
MINNYEQVNLNERELSNLKNHLWVWICHDMRSFRIIEEKELTDIPQDFVVLGKFTIFGRSFN